MLENAIRLCDATFGNLFLYEDGAFRAVALHNAPPAYAEARMSGPVRPGPGYGVRPDYPDEAAGPDRRYDG